MSPEKYARAVRACSLLLTLLTILGSASSGVAGQPLSKVDPKLHRVIGSSNPEEELNVIIEFYEKPHPEWLNRLKEDHGVVVRHTYKIINATAATAKAGEILKIAEYDWVKKIWLDERAYALQEGDRTGGKVDPDLDLVLRRADPLEPIPIIISFYNKPSEEEIRILREDHGLNITYVYDVINAVAGRALAKEIREIAGYDWVEKVWLDEKAYASGDGTSDLVRRLQVENQELERRVAELNNSVSLLQDENSALKERVAEMKRERWATIFLALIAGIIVGSGATMGIGKMARREPLQRAGQTPPSASLQSLWGRH